MARTRNSVQRRRRRKKVLRMARGYLAGRSRQYRAANEAVMRALSYAYRDRRQRKRDFRRLWIARINAAARQRGMSYSRLINGLKIAGVTINRKMLAELAVADAQGFDVLVHMAREKLEA